MYTLAKISHTHIEDPVVHVIVWYYGRLWKQQNNPACTKMTVMASFVATANGH